MRRTYLNTLVAGALLAALWGSTTYYDKRKNRGAAKIASTPQEKILAVDSSHIGSLTFRPRSGGAITCRREGTNWVIAEPRKLAADSTTISGLLSNLTEATVDQVVDPHPSSVKDYGLDPPAFTLEASTDAKPANITLLLGDETPTSGGLYAQVTGNPRVITLASYLKSSLEKNLFDLRDKSAVTLTAEAIQRIEAESKGKHWTLVKNPEGVWELNLPPRARADRFNVDGILDRLKGLMMISVVAEDKKKPGDYGFGTPSLRVVLGGPGGAQTLVFGKKDKDGNRTFAMNSALEPVFTLGSDLLTQFQKDPADFLEKDLFSFSASEVKRVEVQTPQGARVFEQQPKDKWKQTAPTAKEEPAAKVQDFLNRLRDLRAVSFPKGKDLAAFGLTKPAYKFTVQFGDKNQTEVVEASKVGDHVYARRPTDPIASELVKNALDEIEKALNTVTSGK